MDETGAYYTEWSKPERKTSTFTFEVTLCKVYIIMSPWEANLNITFPNSNNVHKKPSSILPLIEILKRNI